MSIDSLLDLISQKSPKPNKFTEAIGKQIRSARTEMNLSQSELAKQVYVRRATISDIETGKTDVDAVTLALLSHILNRPVTYFFPHYPFGNVEIGDLSHLEQELVLYIRRLSEEDIKKIIAQVKAVVNLQELNKYDQ